MQQTDKSKVHYAKGKKSQKATYCMIHFYDIMEKTKLSVLKQTIDCQGLGMRAEVDYKRAWKKSGDNGTVHSLSCGGGYMILYQLKITELYTHKKEWILLYAICTSI